MATLTESADMVGLRIKEIGMLPIYFMETCFDAMKKVVKYTLLKLSDPESLFPHEFSGALVDAAKGGLGPLAAFAANYIKQNAQKLAMAALSMVAAKQMKAIQDTLKNVYRTISLAFAANNMIVFVLLKIVARNCVSQIKRKDERLRKILERLQALTNALAVLNAGDPVLNRYIEELKKAYAEVVLAEGKVRLVLGTMGGNISPVANEPGAYTWELVNNGPFLVKPWKEAIVHIENARKKLRPNTPDGTNPLNLINQGQGTKVDKSSPWLTGAYVLQGATAGFIPTTAEQVDNILAIPQISWQITKEMRDLTVLTQSINGLLFTFTTGTSVLATSMYDMVRGIAFEQIAVIWGQIKDVATLMDKTFTATDAGSSPVRMVAQAFKWSMTLHFVRGSMELIPTKPLVESANELDKVNFYKSAVDKIKELGNIDAGSTIIYESAIKFEETKYVIDEVEGSYTSEMTGKTTKETQGYSVKSTYRATEGRELIGDYEAQMITGLLMANNAVLFHEIGKKALPLVNILLYRTDVSLYRDSELISILESFINYPIANSGPMEAIMEGAMGVLKKAGLDRAANALMTGDWTTFFNLPPMLASFVGAGLSAIAMLKDCQKEKKNDQNTKKLKKYEQKLRGQQDLLNIKISFDFDFEILRNLQVCVDAKALIPAFNFQSLFCDIATEPSYAATFDAMDSVLDIGDLFSSAVDGATAFVNDAAEQVADDVSKLASGNILT